MRRMEERQCCVGLCLLILAGNIQSTLGPMRRAPPSKNSRREDDLIWAACSRRSEHQMHQAKSIYYR